MFFSDYENFPILPQLISKAETEIESIDLTGAGANIYTAAVNNTIGLMIIAPLLVVYLFCQRYLVEGIERSGLVG
jgi:ABC-type glycerol-3-phosphate transport system permease component